MSLSRILHHRQRQERHHCLCIKRTGLKTKKSMFCAVVLHLDSGLKELRAEQQPLCSAPIHPYPCSSFHSVLLVANGVTAERSSVSSQFPDSGSKQKTNIKGMLREATKTRVNLRSTQSEGNVSQG